MGQEVRGVPEAASLSAPGALDDEPAIGLYLARQRRLREISLEDLAARTKIPRRSLERLEAGAFDRVADGFARGFVRTVAEALGLDPDEAVMRLLREPPDEEAEAEARIRALRRALALAVALLFAAVALVLGAWGLAGALGVGDAEPSDPAVVYRRDAVRALAESVADQEDERGSLDSTRGDAPD
jgi:transcriptional regulator with XRE-family HTH domain